ncbi:hypothetical protein TNCV_1355461 [Trichonephila clavipes]|uniref:Uncharacterized protein n=1 Tax=Trichonephila clavipes TaxID=2585209 RepID=A0A8X6SJH9_TRICX|nr:hypothetical protein TNCV_1355461 [Trichonephila clavipes]
MSTPFLNKKVTTFALWSSDLPRCEASVKEFFQSLQPVAKTPPFPHAEGEDVLLAKNILFALFTREMKGFWSANCP